MKCEAAAAILASEGPAPVSVGRQHARSSCVALFYYVVLFYYTNIGESLRSRGQFLTAVDLTLHLKYVAGYTGPLLFLFKRTHNYSVDNHGFKAWRLRRLGRSKVRSASLVRVLSDEKDSSGTGSQGLSNPPPPTT